LPRGKKKLTQDEFVDWTVHVMRFIRDNYKAVVWVAVFSVLFAALVWGGTAFIEYRTEKASTLLYQARNMQSGSEEQLKAFKEIADDYTSTGSGKIAMFMYGEALYEKKDYENAAKEFETLSKKSKGRPFLKVAAMHKLAESFYAMGKIEDAAKTYVEASSVPKNENIDDSLYQAAGCYEDIKNFAEAETIYRKILDTGKNDRIKFQAEERLIWLIASGAIGGS
jgi:tetratricopeptide (TPR) repeat protein